MADDTDLAGSGSGPQQKKKITPGHIDVHPTENAVVVSYFVQTTFAGDDGTPVLSDKKPMQKIIRVKSLNQLSDLNSLAKEIVEKCKLIHPSRIKDVEQTLYYLQKRQKAEDNGSLWPRKPMDDKQPDEDASNPLDEVSSMDNMEQYIEGLYEEIPEKVSSTRHILQLARIPENMEALITNDSLISALSRVLREENKKSMELVTNIMYIFFCFSNFSAFHPVITVNKVGDMCLRITDQELNRYNIWVQDMAKLEARCSNNPENSAYMKELDHENRKFQTMLRKQDQLLFVCFHLLLNLAEDLNIEVKMVKRDIVRYLLILLDRKTPELLILAVTFLKKLSIFKENKDSMVKKQNSKDLLNKLHKILPSEHQGIQNLSLRLLLNLSHDKDFRAALVEHGFLHKMVDLLHNKNNLLLALQLTYQISIDDINRDAFSKTEAVPLLMKMILEYKGERVNIELMAIAINLATSSKNALMICDGLKFLMRRALKTRDVLLLKMLRNVAFHEGDTKMLFLDYIDDLMHLLLKSLTIPDITVEVLGLLASLNIPDFDFAKLAETYGLLDLVQKRLEMAVSAAAAATAAATAGDMSSPKSGKKESAKTGSVTGTGATAQFAALEGKTGLTEDDDTTLEIVNLLGTMSNDENIAPMVAKTEIISLLIDLMIAKEEDDEIILQIIYCIYQLLLHQTTRNILILQTQVVSYLIDLLYDRNIEIRKMCDVCLDIISEIDEEWVIKIKQQKFQWHNAEYLSLLAQGVASSVYRDEDEEDEEDEAESNSRSGTSTPESRKQQFYSGLGRTNMRQQRQKQQRQRDASDSDDTDCDDDRQSTLRQHGGEGMAGRFGDSSDDDDDEDAGGYGGRRRTKIGGKAALLEGP